MPSRRPSGHPVLDAVPAQPDAIAFLNRAVERPHHAYLLAGPEGSRSGVAPGLR